MPESVVVIARDVHRGGSVGAVAWRHALALGRTWRVHVVTCDAPPGEHPNVHPIIVTHPRWTWLRRFGHVPSELSFVRAARSALLELGARERIGVVWCHSHASAALAAIPLRERLGFRVVMTTHGDIFDRPPGTYTRELTWLYKAVTPRAYRESDYVQVLSPFMAQCAMRGGAPAERVRLIPNGVDPAEIGAEAGAPRAAASFLRDGTLRLLYVGSLAPVKGVDVLIRAVAELAGRGDAGGTSARPGAAARLTLTLVGDGPLASELRQLSQRLGLGECVTFAGPVPRRALAAHYASADILCVPSVSEPLPTVALEAMASGLPLAGTRVGGIPYLVDDGENGTLAHAHDAASFADAIARAAVSREHLARLGERSFLKARERFRWESITERLTALARDAIRPHDRGVEGAPAGTAMEKRSESAVAPGGRSGAAIAIIVHNASSGSVGAVAWRHAIELSRDHRVYLITGDAPREVREGIVSIVVAPRSWNWLRRFCHVPNELAFNAAARSALADLCRRERIDVVWCHSHGLVVHVATPVAKERGCRIVMTTHGDIFDRPPGTYTRELTWYYKAVTPRAYREAGLIHVLSPYMGECAIRSGAAPDRIRQIPNGIDPEAIGAGQVVARAAASFMPDATLRLLYVGSFWRVKGVDVLLRAVARLNDQAVAAMAGAGARAFRRVEVTLIGEGTLEGEIRKLAADLDLGDRLSMPGRIPRGELAAHYRRADLLCIPSLSEALPTVVLEAMLCGLPVVGSDTGGIALLVQTGVNGYLATPGDVAGLADCIARAAASREHLAELGARSVARVREQFDWNRISGDLSRLAGESGGSR